jgi:hypothetical protein
MVNALLFARSAAVKHYVRLSAYARIFVWCCKSPCVSWGEAEGEEALVKRYVFVGLRRPLRV